MAPQGFALTGLGRDFFGYGVEEGVALGLEVAVEGADMGRVLHGFGEEGGEFLEGDDGGELGGDEEVVC